LNSIEIIDQTCSFLNKSELGLSNESWGSGVPGGYCCLINSQSTGCSTVVCLQPMS
jgi:hypothetical protein